MDDRIRLNFAESEDLNTVVTVDKDGKFEVPIIVNITVSGLTVYELRDKIISQMASYNKVIKQLSVSIVEFGRNRVYVTGHVRTPGKYSFEEIPSIWDIILEAGGPLGTAILDEVAIIRSRGGGKIISVDLSDALQKGQLNSLPKIQPGDTIHIPGRTQAGGEPSPLIKKDEIYIMGAVGVPGAHKFESGLNLVEVIGKAGGPTPDANLHDVQYVTFINGEPKVYEFNLDKYFKHSVPYPMPVKAGDTIFVPWRRPFPAIVVAILSTVLTTTITVIITARLAR